MNAKTATFLVSGLLTLAACSDPASQPPAAGVPETSQPSKPVTQQGTLGVFALEFSGIGTAEPVVRVQSVSGSGLSSQEIAGLSFEVVETGSEVDVQTGTLHLNTTLRMTNTSGQDLVAPAFVPVELAGGPQATVVGTALRSLTYYDGTDASAEAPRVQLETRQEYSAAAGGFVTQAEATPLVSGLNTAGLNVNVTAPTRLVSVSRSAWVGGATPQGAQQSINLSARVPLKNGSTPGERDPYRMTLMFTVADNLAASTTTRIGDIQGATPSGDAPAALTGTQKIEGIVTADFREGLKGFFVQESALASDGNPDTSDGIFVYCNTSCPQIAVGDLVRVTGNVNEYYTATQITAATTEVLASGQALPAPVALQLPLPVADRERYEGMLVTVDGTVTNNYTLGRYGQVDIADSRIYQFTQISRPDATALAAYEAEVADRTLTVDDGSTAQNPEDVFGRGGQPLSAVNTLRGGDMGTVTGPLTFSFDVYRVHATSTDFQPTNERTNTPEAVGGDLRVASMNVLNFFNSLDGSNSGCTVGGTSPDSRGANDCTEFERQQVKILEAIEGLDAAVLGVNEIENDYAEGSRSSAATLVAALNTRAGFEKYAYVNPKSNIGSDAIAVGFIYQPALVQEVGRVAILDSRFDPAYIDTKNRPTLAQTFQSVANGGRFTAAVAHLKSKGSKCNEPNEGLDGQGNCAQTRTDAARVMAKWLATNPTGVAEDDRVILGDLNAYAMEDPIAALESAGYANVFSTSAYSYQFNGQWGSLDHALTTSSLLAQVTGQTKWHINADEPISLDYNTEFKSPTQITGYFAPDAFRSSDHDPVLLGLSLSAQEPMQPLDPAKPVDPNPTDPNPTDPNPTDPQPQPAGGTLFFSEYIEGSSNNKAFEIYNGGSEAVDLSGYELKRYANGKTAPDGTVTLSGTLAAGDVFVVANPAAAPELLALADLTSGTVSHNGDDTFVLQATDGTVLDVFGRIGERVKWSNNGVSAENATLRRKASVTAGDADGSDAFDPSAEWEQFPIDDFSGLGVR